MDRLLWWGLRASSGALGFVALFSALLGLARGSHPQFIVAVVAGALSLAIQFGLRFAREPD